MEKITAVSVGRDWDPEWGYYDDGHVTIHSWLSNGERWTFSGTIGNPHTDAILERARREKVPFGHTYDGLTPKV